MRDDPFGAVLRFKQRASHLRSNLLASTIVTRLLAGDHDDAAYGVMGPTGVFKLTCLLEPLQRYRSS
jgi:hypothetical protein